jgi:hypothetical protein
LLAGCWVAHDELKSFGSADRVLAPLSGVMPCTTRQCRTLQVKIL